MTGIQPVRLRLFGVQANTVRRCRGHRSAFGTRKGSRKLGLVHTEVKSIVALPGEPIESTKRKGACTRRSMGSSTAVSQCDKIEESLDITPASQPSIGADLTAAYSNDAARSEERPRVEPVLPATPIASALAPLPAAPAARRTRRRAAAAPVPEADPHGLGLPAALQAHLVPLAPQGPLALPLPVTPPAALASVSPLPSPHPAPAVAPSHTLLEGANAPGVQATSAPAVGQQPAAPATAKRSRGRPRKAITPAPTSSHARDPPPLNQPTASPDPASLQHDKGYATAHHDAVAPDPLPDPPHAFPHAPPATQQAMQQEGQAAPPTVSGPGPTTSSRPLPASSPAPHTYDSPSVPPTFSPAFCSAAQVAGTTVPSPAMPGSLCGPLPSLAHTGPTGPGHYSKPQQKPTWRAPAPGTAAHTSMHRLSPLEQHLHDYHSKLSWMGLQLVSEVYQDLDLDLELEDLLGSPSQHSPAQSPSPGGEEAQQQGQVQQEQVHKPLLLQN